MRSRPKVPRTPINEELLTIIKKENESILQNSVHIYKNESAKKKAGGQSKPTEDVSPAPVAAIRMVDEAKEEPAISSPEKPAPTIQPELDIEIENKRPTEEVKTKVPAAAAEMKVEGDGKKEEGKKDASMSTTQEMKFAFKTRTKLVRTPPGKHKEKRRVLQQPAPQRSEHKVEGGGMHGKKKR